MKTLERMEQQVKDFAGARDAEGMAKFKEALEYLKEHNSAELRDRMAKHITAKLDELEPKVKELTAREQLGDIYEMLPLSFIAREYFGKSPAWLLQRINGYKVNGKARAFSEEEKEKFNFALQDLSKRIGSFRV